MNLLLFTSVNWKKIRSREWL